MEIKEVSQLGLHVLKFKMENSYEAKLSPFSLYNVNPMKSRGIINNGRQPEPHSGVDRRLKFDQCSISMRSDIRETHYTELIHGSILEIILVKLSLDPVVWCSAR
jgi:hypothetical protein